MPDQKKQPTQQHREADAADTLSLEKETLKDLQPTDDAEKVRGAACARSNANVRPNK